MREAEIITDGIPELPALLKNQENSIGHYNYTAVSVSYCQSYWIVSIK